MSYQVLARKYRPRDFSTLAGQEHVVRALTHALTQQRLHHAYLFTGTRGVGKTTLSRILAKALNCIGVDGKGNITAQPCGQCEHCRAIDSGNFIDYIEMDAASNRGVSEMAELLEQAVYAPTQGRIKIYMIDEVHMLTNHAFNAMLKTLEEPPSHVKFILATTDPQKIPPTVLSRCLQFNLKQMPPEIIAQHLASVLTQESIPFETPALAMIAKAAHGSMRDALSLTDQAIVYSGDTISRSKVTEMFGALDQSYLFRILDALTAQEGASLFAIAQEMSMRSLSFSGALTDLANLLQQIAIVQVASDALSQELPEYADVQRLAQTFSGTEVQVYYQIVTYGSRDLSLAPDEFAGFMMTLLRLLRFNPSTSENSAPPSERPLTRPPSTQGNAAEARPNASPVNHANAHARPAVSAAPAEKVEHLAAPDPIESEERAEPEERAPEPHLSLTEPVSSAAILCDAKTWLSLVAQLPLKGMAQQLVYQSELIMAAGQQIHLRIPSASLRIASSEATVQAALSTHFGQEIRLSFSEGAVSQTYLMLQKQTEQAHLTHLKTQIESDSFFQNLVRDLGASLIPESIRLNAAPTATP